MNPADAAPWRRSLEEASCLPPGEPERRAVEAEITARGPLAEREWMLLLDEAERLRLALRRVQVPADLVERLSSIPREARSPGAWLRGRGRLVLAAVAVAAALLLAFHGWRTSSPARPHTPDPLASLALLALNDHLDTHRLEVLASDPEAVAAALAGAIPFPIRLPRLEAPARLEGGRRCTLGSHPVCFTTWRLGEARITLLQLRRRDFDLPEHLAPTVVAPQGAAAGRRPLDVLLWTSGEDGYAVVADDPTLLSRLVPDAR